MMSSPPQRLSSLALSTYRAATSRAGWLAAAFLATLLIAAHGHGAGTPFREAHATKPRVKIQMGGTATVDFTPPYRYKLDKAITVKEIVMNNAGVGKG